MGFVWKRLEMFDLDGHKLGTILHYRPNITGHLGIEQPLYGSEGLTFSNDHSKAEVKKKFGQE